jgi:hypothetical protein
MNKKLELFIGLPFHLWRVAAKVKLHFTPLADLGRPFPNFNSLRILLTLDVRPKLRQPTATTLGYFVRVFATTLLRGVSLATLRLPLGFVISLRQMVLRFPCKYFDG